MIYIGNLYHTDLPEKHCYFSIVAECNSIDEAIEKFKSLITEIKGKNDTLEGAKEIILDSIVEFISIPKEGVMFNYTEVYLSSVLRLKLGYPVVGEYDNINVYDLGPENETDELPVFARVE